MKPISARRLIQILTRHGFVLVRQKGSHLIYKNTISGIIAPVPLHGKNRPLPIGTLLAIAKQSQIPKKRFQ